MDKVFASKVSALLNNREGKPINEEDIYQYLTSQGYPISSMEDLKIDLQEMYSKGFIYPYQGYWYPTYHSEVWGAADISPDSKNNFRYPATQYSPLLTGYEKVKPETRDKYKEEWKDKLSKYYDYFKKSHPEYSNFFKWVDQSTPNYYEFIKDAMAIFLQMNMEHNSIKYPNTEYAIPDELTTIEHAMNEAVYRLTTFMKKEHGAKVIPPDVYRKAYDNVAELSAEIQSKFILEVIATSPSGTIISADTVKKFTENALKKSLPKEVPPDFFLNVIEGKLSNLKHSKEKGVFLYNTSATTIATYLQDSLLKSPAFVSTWNTFMKTKGGFQGTVSSIINKVWSEVIAPGHDFHQGLGIDLEKVNISNSNLSNCNFTNADLSGASITNCNLRGSLFKESVFKPTTFTGNDITKMDVDGAVLGKDIAWDENKGQPINLVYREVSYDKKDLDNIIKSPQVYSYAFPLAEAEEGDALNLVYALKGYLDSLQILSFRNTNFNLTKTSSLSDTEVNALKSWLESPENVPNIEVEDLKKWLADKNKSGELAEAGFNKKDINLLFGRASTLIGGPKKPPSEIARDKRNELSQNFAKAYGGKDNIPKTALLGVLTNEEGNLHDWLQDLPDKVTYKDIFNIYHVLLSSLKQFHLTTGATTLTRKYEHLPYTTYVTDLEHTERGVSGKGTQFGVTLVPIYNLMPQGVAEVAQRAVREGSTHMYEGLAFSRIFPMIYHEIRSGTKGKIFKKVWAVSEMQSDSYQKSGKSEEDPEDEGNERTEVHKKYYKTTAELDKAMTNFRRYIHHWPENLLNAIIELAQKHNVDEIWMPTGKDVAKKTGKGDYTAEAWYKYYDRPAKTFGGKIKNVGADITLDPGSSYSHKRAEWYVIPIKKQTKEGSLNFSSQDPSFNDYDVTRNDFFMYDKDQPSGNDSLDMSQPYHTDYWKLKDTDKEKKERESLDWTGRENLQLGFGSLKLGWQLPYTAKIGDRVKVEHPEGYVVIDLIEEDPIDEPGNGLMGQVIESNNPYWSKYQMFYLPKDTKWPVTKVSSLTFSNDIYFDSTPSEDTTPEERNFTNPLPDKKLRRTDPKKYDRRHDWYSQSPDAEVSNRYDNSIPLEANLKLGWRTTPELGTLDALRDFISNMEPNVRYKFDANFPYKDAELELSDPDNDGRMKYTWILHNNYDILGVDIWPFPTHGNMVVFWSKKSSAEKSLYKKMSWLYDESTGELSQRWKNQMTSSLKLSWDTDILYFNMDPEIRALAESLSDDDWSYVYNPNMNRFTLENNHNNYIIYFPYDTQEDSEGLYPFGPVTHKWRVELSHGTDDPWGWEIEEVDSIAQAVNVINQWKDTYRNTQPLHPTEGSLHFSWNFPVQIGDTVELTKNINDGDGNWLFKGEKGKVINLFEWRDEDGNPEDRIHVTPLDNPSITWYLFTDEVKKVTASSLKLSWKVQPDTLDLEGMKNVIMQWYDRIEDEATIGRFHTDLEIKGWHVGDPLEEGLDNFSLGDIEYWYKVAKAQKWRLKHNGNASLKLGWQAQDTAESIAERTQDAYSFNAYRMPYWIRLTQHVLDWGLTPEETEEFLRSKYTRWLRDSSDFYNYEDEHYGPRKTERLFQQLLKDADARKTEIISAIRRWMKEASLKFSWQLPKNVLDYPREIEWLLNENGYTVHFAQSKGPAGYPNMASTINLVLFKKVDETYHHGFRPAELKIQKEKIRNLLRFNGYNDVKVTNTSYGSILVVVPYQRRDPFKNKTEGSLKFSWDESIPTTINDFNIQTNKGTIIWAEKFTIPKAKQLYGTSKFIAYIEKDDKGKIGGVIDTLKGETVWGDEYPSVEAAKKELLSEIKAMEDNSNWWNRGGVIGSLKFSDLQDYPWDEIKHNLGHHFNYVINENRRKFPDVEKYVTDEMMAQFAYKTFFTEYNIPGVWRGDPEFIDELKRIIKDDLGYTIYSPPYIDWFHWMQKAWDDIRYFLKNQRENIAPDMNVSDQELARDWLKLWQEEKQVPMDIQRAVWYNSVFLKAIQTMFEDKGLGDVLGTEYQAPQSPEERIEQILRPDTGVNEDEGDIPVDREGNPLPKDEDIWAGTNYKPPKEVPVEKVPEVNTDELLDELHDAILKGDDTRVNEIKKKLNELQSKSSLKLGWQPQPGKTWYAVVKSYGRGDENTRKVKMNFPWDEDPKVIFSILTAAGWFGIASAKEEYQQYLENKDTENLQFYGEISEGLSEYKEGGDSFVTRSEEWEAGFGLTPASAAEAFLSIGGDEDWMEDDTFSSLKFSWLTPDDISGGYPFIYDKKTNHLYLGDYNSVHYNAVNKHPEELKEYVRLDNKNIAHLQYIQGRVNDAGDRVAFWEESSPNVETKDAYTDCIFQLQQENIVGSNPHIYFTGGYSSPFKDFVEFPAREASLKLGWQFPTLKSKIEVGGVKHKILSYISNAPDGIGRMKDIVEIASADYGYRFQYFSQLQDQGFVERVNRGLYRLTDKGKELLNYLDSKISSLKFSWKTFPVSRIQPGSKAYRLLTFLYNMPGHSASYTEMLHEGHIVGIYYWDMVLKYIRKGIISHEKGGLYELTEEGVKLAEYLVINLPNGSLQDESSLVFNIDKKGQGNGENQQGQEENPSKPEAQSNTQPDTQTPQSTQKVNVRYPSVEDIIEIHDEVINAYGGMSGTMAGGEARIEAAIGRMQSGFGDREFYVSILEKAAVLCHSIITTHPFGDANKRTAFLSAVYFLHDNGFAIEESEPLADVIIEVASDNAGYDQLLQWIQTNAKEVTDTHGEALLKLTWQVQREVSPEKDFEEEWQKLKIQIMKEEGYDERDMEDDSIEDRVNRMTDKWFLSLYGKHLDSSLKFSWKQDPQAEDIDRIQRLFPGVKLRIYRNIDGRGTAEVNVPIKAFLAKFPDDPDYFFNNYSEITYDEYTWNFTEDDKWASTFIQGPEEETTSSLQLKDTELQFKEGE